MQVLREIGDFEIAACRSKKGMKKIPEDIGKRIKYFYTVDDAFAWDPDFLIVSNPTNFHLEYILKSIDYNIDALIEKPVATYYSEIKAVEDRIKKRKNKIYVGFNLRFNQIVKKVKEIIDTREYGKVLKANLYVGEYLPFWHPYEDYRSSYAARKELGGGVLRALSHELDLGQYWFDNYDKIFAKIIKLSDLEINVDDCVDIFAEMKNNIILKISMDYLNPLGERSGELFFEDGLLKYDFLKRAIEFTSYATKKSEILLKLGNYDYNEQYKSQMEKFLDLGDKEICTLEEGINVMKIIDKCEESNRTGSMLYV